MKPPINEKQRKQKDAYLRKNYNITLDQYDELRRHQDYKCGICRADEADFKNGMAVDHCHRTGEVRGLLCWKCNRALGRFEDSVERVQQAAIYVTSTPVECWFLRKIFTAPGRVGTKARAKVLAKLNGTPTPKRKRRRTLGKATKRTRTKRT